MANKVLITAILIVSFCGLKAQEVIIRKPHLDIVLDSTTYHMQQVFLEESQDRGITGYRIQIFNGSRSESLQMRSQFIAAFPRIAVYSIYEQPEFKIRVGNYRTRLEAERALIRIQEVFSGSLILKTTVKFPQ